MPPLPAAPLGPPGSSLLPQATSAIAQTILAGQDVSRWVLIFGLPPEDTATAFAGSRPSNDAASFVRGPIAISRNPGTWPTENHPRSDTGTDHRIPAI